MIVGLADRPRAGRTLAAALADPLGLAVLPLAAALADPLGRAVLPLAARLATAERAVAIPHDRPDTACSSRASGCRR
ncbi:hypothetical protein [Actinocatenispora sera]|uniref:Uncharacterized protein n=1 Tax=Actinocatenispora sera TaxID=390989 RepID=A0A810L3N4_9ACTN|nr:hypothetical protein [Actinocatenispora sera]BCJ29837.1 hypothetical protein Asera_39450 [Actinocatenispora sera]